MTCDMSEFLDFIYLLRYALKIGTEHRTMENIVENIEYFVLVLPPLHLDSYVLLHIHNNLKNVLLHFTTFFPRHQIRRLTPNLVPTLQIHYTYENPTDPPNIGPLDCRFQIFHVV